MGKTKKLFRNEQASYLPKADDILSIIQKRYGYIISSLIITGILLCSLLDTQALLIAYIFIALLLGACCMMYQDLYYFQRMGLRHRPFLMTQYFELIAVAGISALIMYTIPYAQTSGDWWHYSIIRVSALSVWGQFRAIFVAISHYQQKETIVSSQ